ncbi:MAG: phosphatase PAP2 family protein [Anaerolineales bacterium]|nr:phosphatase PAP2 family protein [Anaerolineales bacterium]
MTDALAETKRRFQYQRQILAVQFVMIAVMSLFILAGGKLPGWDMLGLLLFALFLWFMRGRIRFLDFSPFLLMLFTYEVIRSVILAVGTKHMHITDIAAWERALFAGIVPASALQQAFGAAAFTGLLDVVTNAFYMTHFFSVIVVGFILWRVRKAHYWAYMMGLIVLSYTAFLTYVVFPAAPPWWASMHGYLRGHPVNLDHSLLSPGYIYATANPLCAMPSVHTAWPVYLFFYCLYVWGRKALPVVILPVGVAVSSVYLGHHYIVDILGGIGYAVPAFVFATQMGKIYLKFREPTKTLAAV